MDILSISDAIIENISESDTFTMWKDGQYMILAIGDDGYAQKLCTGIRNTLEIKNGSPVHMRFDVADLKDLASAEEKEPR